LNNPNEPNKRITPVTIAIGLLSNDSIIVAADSQTTCDNIKNTDAEKISLVEFADCGVMVAQAGNADRAGRAIEILSDMASSEKLSNKRSAAELAERAILQVKKELRQQQCDCTMEELRDFVWKHEQDFKLLIAHYFEGVPYFYIADFLVGAANRENRHFAAIGTGAELASYLLGEYFKPNTPFNPTFATALYVIEEVKKHDSYCSGTTRFAFARPQKWPGMMLQELIDDICKELGKFNEATRESRNKTMTEMLESVGRQWAKKFKEEESQK
jgi:20S proteasome alpha/beta subunit